MLRTGPLHAFALFGFASLFGIVACSSDDGSGSFKGNSGGGDNGSGPGSGCGASSGTGAGTGPGSGGGPLPPPPACAPAATGSATVQAPTLLVTLKDRWEEAWLGSPAVADLDGDGVMEIIVPRGEAL